MASKILLAFSLFLLASKYGLFGKLKHLKPRLDRAVNFILIGLVLIYLGQLVWWLVQGRPAH